jgi:glycine cleavage system H protein
MKYTKEHDWLRVDDNDLVVGTTEFATEQLGDFVFVELPEPGALVTRGDEIVVIESVESASEISATDDEEIVAVKEVLVDGSNLVNKHPNSWRWFFKIKLVDMTVLNSLMDEVAYQDMVT